MSWSTLPIKYLIVDLLDYESRCNLRLCSKADRFEVDSRSFVAKQINIREIFSHMDQEKTILRIEIDTFTIWFIGKNEVTKVDRGWNREVETDLSEMKQEKRHDVARRFLDKYTERYGSFSADTISVEVPDFAPSDHWKLNCRDLKLQAMDGEASWAVVWMATVKSDLNRLQLCNWTIVGIGNMEQVQRVREELTLRGETDIDDEQLALFKAPVLHIGSTGITAVGIQLALKRFFTNARDDDILSLGVEFPENFNHMDCFSKEWLVKKKTESEEERVFVYSVSGNLENVHAAKGHRLVEFLNYQMVVARFAKPEKHNNHILWPF